ncbi:hypothetical protein [Butyrivibrio sp. INlla16]|uniref:hypothetical protein n=1 Tax=Butyrivibrio sp. INlla16 TaxID=1520807 RepID=UPI000887D77D|nr:hypothetical protein [Butyrivibrio sp. INlla16]SDB68267.1 hypothetical protein SAMN02910263_04135 [Butyrivibrio sp. INlla16]
MFINRKTHYLSDSLFCASGIHLLANLILFIARQLIRSKNASRPDMLNSRILMSQFIVSSLMILVMAFVFVSKWRALKKSLSVVEESDKLKMAVLQQEVMGSSVPTLSGDAIIQLLELWGVILVGVRLVYDISSIVYRKFILNLTELADYTKELREQYVMIYNSSHGFKYISLLVALLLGLFMTGICLKDRLLKAMALLLISFFLISFVLLGMQTVTVGDYRIGIVWSSLIFHFTETFGLLGLGIYLRRRYVGV